MNATKVVAMILIALGLMALAFQGFQYTTKEKVVDLGPIEINADKTHGVVLSPIVGLAAVAGGIALLVFAGKKSQA
jgi:hypothetical protein